MDEALLPIFYSKGLRELDGSDQGKGTRSALVSGRATMIPD